MYQGDSSSQERAVDVVMTGLYRQLDEHDLPGETPFNTAAGLRDLARRIQDETRDVPQQAHADQEHEHLGVAAHETAGSHHTDTLADPGETGDSDRGLTAHTEEPAAPARPPDHADHIQPTGTEGRGRREKPKRDRRSFVSRHRLATGVAIAAAVGARAVLRKARWTYGTARVRNLVIRPGGWVIVEMDDHAVFVADPESYQRLQKAQQSWAPVPYWINNFKIIEGRPYGGIGGIDDMTRTIQFT